MTAPSVPPGRLVGLDVARALALLGMVATHTLSPMTADGGVTVVQQVAGGRSSALFAVLAGVSLSLVSGRTDPVRGRRRRAVSVGLLVRAVALVLIGLLLGSVPSGLLVILAYYGVLFAVGVLLLPLGARALAVLCGACVVALPVVSQLVRQHLRAAPIESPTLASLAEPGQLLTQLTLTGTYPTLTWMGYLLAGMAVGRLDLTRRVRAVDLVVVGACLALAAWAASALLVGRAGVEGRLAGTLTGPYAGNLSYALDHGLYGTTPTGSWWWLATDAPHTGSWFDLAGTIGSALVVIGGCLLAARSAPRVLRVVFGAGTMTLTLYVGHVMLRGALVAPEGSAVEFWVHVPLVLGVGMLFVLAGWRGPLERGVGAVSQRAARSLVR